VPSEIPHHRDRIGDPGLARALRRRLEGDIRFDRQIRALYATDASIYQLEPIGVVFPRSTEDVSATMEVARAEGLPVLPRGAGTSQCGQTVGHAIILDTSRYLNRILSVDPERRRALVQPGVVLDRLNDVLAPTSLMFPVDVATSNRATLGGMAGNNSGGARSIRYGIMADNVAEIEAELPDGRVVNFGSDRNLEGAAPTLARSIGSLVTRHRTALEDRVPDVLRHVAGYNLHRLLSPGASMAELLVGSEGTLAYFRTLNLRLTPVPGHRVLGVCHFPGLVAAMDAVQHIVALDPHAVELVDEHLLRLARANEAFKPTVEQFMPGDVGSVLLVEFAGDDPDLLGRRLVDLGTLVGDLETGGRTTPAPAPGDQARIWALRRASLSIAMSMKGDRKPVSFVEDCAVPLPTLGEYATSLEEIFGRHRTSSIWYAHASVGCLHVRPALSMKDPTDVATMRAIAQEVHEVVRRLGGSHSGEHGDGILRSEFIGPNLGPALNQAFRDLKSAFDPAGLMNPGKIVAPPAMDDRRLFRYGPSYRPKQLPTVLDWSVWGGFSQAIEMCNNNGACRKLDAGAMCPSYRVTLQEGDTTRGRANILRQALDGAFGADNVLAEEVLQVLDLCVGCKACKTECPTGVDMARMKAEVAYRKVQAGRIPPREWLTAHLPRIAPAAARLAPAANLMSRMRGARTLGERVLGLTRQRALPPWHRHPYRDRARRPWHGAGAGGEIVIFADTFHRYFDPGVIRQGISALEALTGAPVWSPPAHRGRPLCCGRTYISGGLLGQAREELRRTIAALFPAARAGASIVGFEPSCVGTLRDEAIDLVPGFESRAVANSVSLLDEYLSERTDHPDLLAGTTAHVHTHCHQKSLGDPSATIRLLENLGGNARAISGSCCGMAGSFGYEVEHFETSMNMGELTLFPAVRRAPEAHIIVANGFSCRAQVRDGTGRRAIHVGELLGTAAYGT